MSLMLHKEITRLNVGDRVRRKEQSDARDSQPEGMFGLVLWIGKESEGGQRLSIVLDDGSYAINTAAAEWGKLQIPPDHGRGVITASRSDNVGSVRFK